MAFEWVALLAACAVPAALALFAGLSLGWIVGFSVCGFCCFFAGVAAMGDAMGDR